MKVLFSLALLLLCYASGFTQINTPSGATVPFGTNTTYSGHYILPTNLPSGGQYGSSQDAASAYNTWKANYVEPCGTNEFRVKFDNPNQTVSEGIGYGMLLAAYAADKALFDGLWTYYKHYADTNGLMNWRIEGCTNASGFGSATDGDFDAAMALIVAARQWPNDTLPYAYTFEAWAMIQALQQWGLQPAGSPGQFQPTNGDQWGFSSTCRNPSYFAPAYYQMFEYYVPWQPLVWALGRTAGYAMLQANVDTNTGLVSNWCDENGTPNSCNGPNEYGWDACRHPWRMGVCAAWYGDSIAVDMCYNIANFVAATGVANLKGPMPQGGGTGSFHSPAFVSTWAAAVVGTYPASQALLNECYTETVNVVDNPPYYFGNTLRVLSLFLMTGNFWKPDWTVMGVEEGVAAPFEVWPNPSSGQFRISVGGFVEVMDVFGRCVYAAEATAGGTLELSGVSKGHYFVRVAGMKGGRVLVVEI
jgi:endo-1,4-beta-D-glucanase Y